MLAPVVFRDTLTRQQWVEKGFDAGLADLLVEADVDPGDVRAGAPRYFQRIHIHQEKPTTCISTGDGMACRHFRCRSPLVRTATYGGHPMDRSRRALAHRKSAGLSFFMAPQDAALVDPEHVQLLCEAWDAELGDEAQRAPLGVASRDAVLGGPDYVEPAGGAPWGALLGGQDYVEHLGAAPRGAVLGSLDDQNGSGEWLPPKYSNLGAVADSQSDLRL